MAIADRNDRAVLRWIAASLPPSTRRKVLATGAIDLLVRLGGLATAFTVGGNVVTTVACALATALLVFVKRVVTLTLRIETERDMQIAVARSLLETDVLDEPPVEPHAAIADGIFQATALASDTVPALAADALASIVAAGWICFSLPLPVTGIVVVSGAVVGATSVLLRSRIADLHERSLAAQDALRDEFATNLHGRLEIVANGIAEAARTNVVRVADHFAREATRSARGIALLGRAPVLLAVLVAAALLAVFGALPTSVWSQHLQTLAILAAAIPTMLGIVFGAQALLRARKKLGPFGLVVLGRTSLRGRDLPPAIASIAFDHVRFGYDAATLVLANFVREWPSGLLVLRGPNGSGKSTILRLLAGLRDPDDGAILVGSSDLRSVHKGDWRRRVGFFPQRPYLGEPYATVMHAFQLVAPDVTSEQARRALERLGVLEVLTKRGDPLARFIGQLSIGQRQRVAIARVLARNADLLLLDEPDANLDADGIDRLVTILEEEVAAGKMVAIAAHGPIAERLRGTVWDLGDCKEG